MFGLTSQIMIGYYLASKMLKSNKKDGSKNIPLPSFKNIIEVKHFLAGRVRIYAPKLVNNETDKNLLSTQFSKIDGINEFQVNTLTGSILVLYDINKVDAGILYSAIIRLLELEPLIDNKKTPLVSREIKQVGEAFNQGIFEKTNGIIDAETIIPVSFIILALKEIYNNPSAGKPGAYTLLWWAYNILRRGGA
ncbi:HMA2 domain-containing protein [Oceanirhabdus sp. W0125-5]|uniref:HMA2 domain-containing protein n=1 Tax=Oceanirhabdus sp. W0125-5 TaxID=2999116 RepID=UPI0022F33897|nr:hypothetical protein [Oceanirhabdus sp. W0125-5]WBW95034.1 hypothetical protein OW730_15205 [Oceanirhabdus sp. W0125-5]